MEIKPTYVTFTQSKLLKEKGWDINTYSNCWVKTLDGHIIHNSERISCAEHDRCEQYLMQPEQWQVVEWLRVKHGINVEANRLSNIGKYRWLAIPMNIIPKSFKTKKEYLDAVYKYYGKDNFDSPQEAYSAAFDYVLKELI